MNFLYNHANNSLALRIATLPMFSKVPLGFMIVVLAQSIICLAFRIKLKEETIVVKFLSRPNNSIIKLTSNTVAVHRNDNFIGVNEEVIQIVKRSTVGEDFAEESCCMCNG